MHFYKEISVSSVCRTAKYSRFPEFFTSGDLYLAMSCNQTPDLWVFPIVRRLGKVLFMSKKLLDH